MISLENWKPAPELCDERARLTRREQRYDHYQQVMAFYEQGLGFTEIAGRVGLSRRTIERWIKEGDFPETKRQSPRRSVFDPYATYVLWRWEQGCTNGLQLWQEIKAKGYQGSAQTVYRYLRSLRKKRRIIWKPEVPHAPLQDFSAHDAVWLFARDPDSLDEKEQETLMVICQASETAHTTYQLVQEFRHLLHHRQGGKLDAWLEKGTASQIRELQSFVKAGRTGQGSSGSGADPSSEQRPGRRESEQAETDQADGIWPSRICAATPKGSSRLMTKRASPRVWFGIERGLQRPKET